jgi:subtilisin family serine protease
MGTFKLRSLDYQVLKLTFLIAAPHVAGLVAYIIAKENPQPDQIRNRIVELATTNKVIDPMGSANRIANNGNGVN